MEGEVLDVEIGASGGEGAEVEQQPDLNAQRQSDREYQNWIKGLREDGESGKYARRVKDDFGRLQAIHKLDPKGFDGIRSTYDNVKGIAYGDKTGLEAVSSMRNALTESQGLLDGVAEGNFEALSEDHRNGIIRMTPALLDTLADSNPEAYAAALLPHFVESLRESGLVQHFNTLASILSQQPPSYLTKEQHPTWIQDQLAQVLTSAKGMSQWFREQEQRVKELGGKAPDLGARQESQPRQNEQQGTANPQFWQEKVHPETNRFAEETFNRELKPWEEKLAAKGFRLSKLEKGALAQQFVASITGLAKGNKDYTSQMSRYDRMKSPDAASVLSVFRGEFGKHANTVMRQLIEENYGDKLKGGKPGPKPNQQRSAAPSAPEKNVVYGSVKPRREDIDILRTPKDWIYDDSRFRRILKNGKIFELRA